MATALQNTERARIEQVAEQLYRIAETSRTNRWFADRGVDNLAVRIALLRFAFDPKKLEAALEHAGPTAAFDSIARTIPSHSEREIDELGIRELFARAKAGAMESIAGHIARVRLDPAEESDAEFRASVIARILELKSRGSDMRHYEMSSPSDISELMAAVLFAMPLASHEGKPATLCDPCCGLGTGLRTANAHFVAGLADKDGQLVIPAVDAATKLECFGQDLNRETVSLCRVLNPGAKINVGNTLEADPFDQAFAYQIATPPLKLSWQGSADKISDDHRFFALPPKTDAQLLFLQHVLARMRPAKDGGGRAVVLTSAGPLTNGSPSSGEDKFRQHLIERDLLEAVVVLPEGIFADTGIAGYLWVLTNVKDDRRAGKTLLLNGADFGESVISEFGGKRRRFNLSGEMGIAALVQLIRRFQQGRHARVLEKEDFGYQQLTIQQPLCARYVVDETSKHAVTLARRTPRPNATAGTRSAPSPTSRVAKIAGVLQAKTYESAADFHVAIDLAAAAVDVKVSNGDRRVLVDSVQRKSLSAPPQRDDNGELIPDRALAEVCDVPLRRVSTFESEEVTPYLPDAWIERGKVGYRFEIDIFLPPLSRVFGGDGVIQLPGRALFSSIAIACPDDASEDGDEILYVSRVPYGRAYSFFEELPANQNHIFRISIREGAPVSAAYLVEYLNSQIGRDFRHRIASGQSMPSIHRNKWRSATFFLPNVETQKDTLRLLERTSEIEREAQRIRTAIWESPGSVNTLMAEAERMRPSDSKATMADGLPFPLASILFQAGNNVRAPLLKRTNLINFFEAVSQFTATILLSGFSQDPDLFASHRDGVLRAIEKAQSLSVERSTFGLWNCVVERLGGVLRTHLASKTPKDIERVLEAFSVARSAQLASLSSVAVVEILNQANNLRNRRVAHAGVQSEASAAADCSALEKLVGEYIGEARFCWSSWHLVRPGDGRMIDGVNRVILENLNDARAPFERFEAAVLNPAEYAQLHLYDGKAQKVLPLLPLLRMMASPQNEQNACYFYSRMDGQDVRFVSYHFAEESERTVGAPATVEALDLLRD